jgi:hypothetical protein
VGGHEESEHGFYQGALDEQQAAASEMVKKGVRIVKVPIPLTLHNRIIMFWILTFMTISENWDETTWLASQLPPLSLSLGRSLSAQSSSVFRQVHCVHHAFWNEALLQSFNVFYTV